MGYFPPSIYDTQNSVVMTGRMWHTFLFKHLKVDTSILLLKYDFNLRLLLVYICFVYRVLLPSLKNCGWLDCDAIDFSTFLRHSSPFQIVPCVASFTAISCFEIKTLINKKASVRHVTNLIIRGHNHRGHKRPWVNFMNYVKGHRCHILDFFTC